MKKGVLAPLLALCLLCPFLFPALGAATDSGFDDVDPAAWYADAVTYVRARRLMSGTSATAFEPDATTSRAMLVTILYRQAGHPAARVSAFTDVAPGDWYGAAVGWAAAGGIVSGRTDGRFAPDDPVTREELAVMLWRAADSPAPGGGDAFADQAAISPYAARAVAWAREAGIVGGKRGNHFDPTGHATRAETASMLYRYLRGADSPGPTPDRGEEAEIPKLTLRAGGQSFTLTLSDTPSARAFLERLPLSVTMGELNGNEKYFYLPDALPSAAQAPGRVETGDLMLYGPDCLVLFYKSFSTSYRYTRLGSLDDPEGLADALGDGSVAVTISTLS